jgi:cytochrome c biogenesis protein CcdA/glutaredoxin
MKNILKILIVVVLLIVPSEILAKEKTINIHLFYGDGCPHCAKEEVLLEELEEEYSNIKVYKHEVWFSMSNQKLWMDVQDALKKGATGVPYTVIGNQVITGFSEKQTERDIRYLINYYENNAYRDITGEIAGIVENKEDIKLEDKDVLNSKIYIPLLGDIDPKEASLPIIAIVMGFVDGFNPCAMWVLLFLISMLVGMKDKKRMWILGITFLVTSSLVYLLFMVAWLNLVSFATKLTYIRVLIALVALIAGGWNLKNYLKEKKDNGCEVIDDKKRKNVIDRIIKITKENKFVLALIGIILLAASINVIELLCSAGLPLMFSNILALNGVSTTQSAIYLFLYILFFMLDDLVVFCIAMFTLKVSGFSTKYTKYSHLIGGIIMILIGLLLIFKPELLMFSV